MREIVGVENGGVECWNDPMLNLCYASWMRLEWAAFRALGIAFGWESRAAAMCGCGKPVRCGAARAERMELANLFFMLLSCEKTGHLA